MNKKYGFIYLWFDRLNKRYYVGCRWGNINDGYICSSKWMKKSYKHRPEDFKRRILKTNIPTREQTYEEELGYLGMIKDEELSQRYYNLNNKNNVVWHKYDKNIKTVGQRISASKKGKKLGNYSPEHNKAISAGKKKAFDRKREESGYAIDPEHFAKFQEGRRNRGQSEEERKKRSDSLKLAYAEGRKLPNKPRLPPKPKRERGQTLKELWNDPVWKANQIAKLKAGAKKRPPRSEESKEKTRLSMMGKNTGPRSEEHAKNLPK